MKAIVIKTFKDKITKDILSPGQIIEITEERFGELTGPFGIFVEEIKEEPPMDPPKEENNVTPAIEPPKEEEPPVGLTGEAPTVPNFNKMNKTEIIEYAKVLSIELNMEMSKNEMIEILLKK